MRSFGMLIKRCGATNTNQLYSSYNRVSYVRRFHISSPQILISPSSISNTTHLTGAQSSILSFQRSLKIKKIKLTLDEDEMPQREESKYKTNEAIEAPHVRLVAEDNTNLGVISTQEALRRADNAGLDLVQINGEADPPICKILNFAKFQYELDKKKIKNKSTTKEVVVTPKIADHDLQTKVRLIEDFLEKGVRVRVVVRFDHNTVPDFEFGRALLDLIYDQVSHVSRKEAYEEVTGKKNTISCGLISKKQKEIPQASSDETDVDDVPASTPKAESKPTKAEQKGNK